MAVSHVFSNTISDKTGTVTFWDGATTASEVATKLVRPADWNSAHNQFYTLAGNTSGNSTASGTNVILSGGSNITLAGSTGSIAIIGPSPPTLSFFDNQGLDATAFSNYGDMSLRVFPLTPVNEIMPGNMSVNTIMLNVSQSVSTAATWTNRVSIGFYTSVNSTQLTRVCSGSTSWGTAAGAAGINNTFGGIRWLSIHSSNFDVQPVFSEGVRYWAAIWHRTSNNAGSMTISFMGGQSMGQSGVRSGVMGVASQTDTTLGAVRFNGVFGTTFSSAMPVTLNGSDINHSVAAVQHLPQVILNNVGSNII